MEQIQITKQKAECEWGEESVDKNTLEEAGGCDIIPQGMMVCEECMNIPKHEVLLDFWREHHKD